MTACASPIRTRSRSGRACGRAGATPRHAGNPGLLRAGGGWTPSRRWSSWSESTRGAGSWICATALIGREETLVGGAAMDVGAHEPDLPGVEESRTEGLPELLERRWRVAPPDRESRRVAARGVSRASTLASVERPRTRRSSSLSPRHRRAGRTVAITAPEQVDGVLGRSRSCSRSGSADPPDRARYLERAAQVVIDEADEDPRSDHSRAGQAPG